MSNTFDRRDMMRALGYLGLSVTASPFLFGAPARAARLSVPVTGRYHLHRRLVRGLSDGKAIVVERHWDCEFTPEGSRLRVSGTQTSVTVDAPAKLEPLAAIERQREVAGLFPATIDEQGKFTQPVRGMSAEDLDASIQTALAMYRARGADGETIANAKQFLNSLSNASAAMISSIPPDLFFPAPGKHQVEREIELANGEKGAFLLTAIAEADGGTGLLKHSSREVITSAHGSERHSSESWRLSKA